ncbi:MAG TPA: galactonate dehydratase [Bryobacteraceae bacterium]|nr:galactonate dehydratase [Bryobacteraceae bacterium]
MRTRLTRRSLVASAFASAGLSAFSQAEALAQTKGNNAPVTPKEKLRVTKLETFLVKPRWMFLKIHTNAGIVGLGEPITEGRALTCQTAIKEIEPYLIGKDPRQVAHHWQAIYRHAFYRGGPILTSALSGIDQALWDIKGKALGVPVYEMLGGPTRNKVRVYAHAGTPEQMTAARAKGFTAFKTGPAKKRPMRYVETPAAVQYAVEHFAALRKAMGDEIDIGIDFHGAVSPATAKLLIKGLEPYNPMFVEEPCQAQNHDVMADIARGTHLPIATGERVFTKWGFREVLEKKAATILQPDLCHAGGITEVRLIAGMAEAYYASIAPHNPLGPISLAAGVQIAASIPNFLCQEQVSLGEGYIKQPFVVRAGYLDLPAGPGLGIELDENAMADKIGHDWKNQESYDAEDGSVVDW